MWDLIVSVPDHCLSFYILSFYFESMSFVTVRFLKQLFVWIFCFVLKEYSLSEKGKKNLDVFSARQQENLPVF